MPTTDFADEHGSALHGTRFLVTDQHTFEDVRDRSIVTATGGDQIINGDLAVDLRTASHWAFAYTLDEVGTSFLRAFIGRVGYEAVVTEVQPLIGGLHTFDPVLAFRRVLHQFEVVSARRNSGGADARHFRYPSDAGISVFGQGCGGFIDVRYPFAGNADFTVHLFAAADDQSASLLLGLAQANTPLDPFGLLGCTLYLGLATFIALPPVTIVPMSGATVPLPLPEHLVGDLFARWFHTDPNAPGGARVSDAAQIRVR